MVKDMSLITWIGLSSTATGYEVLVEHQVPGFPAVRYRRPVHRTSMDRFYALTGGMISGRFVRKVTWRRAMAIRDKAGDFLR